MNFWDVVLSIWMVILLLVSARVIYVFVRHRPCKGGMSEPSGTAGSGSGRGSGDGHSWFDGSSDSGGGGGCGGGGSS